MKNKLLAPSKVLLRGVVVIGIFATAGYFVAGPILRALVDFIYRRSGSSFWYNLFYFLSQNRVFILCVGCILVFIATSRWMFRPLLEEYTCRYAELIKDNIRLKKNEMNETPVQFAKTLKPLEDVLNGINTEIRLSRYAAKEAEQRKDDLVVYLAHDIRTPLTSVLGYLELLTENQNLPKAQQKKFMDSALRKARRMQLLVEELFEVTRYSITQIELEKSPVNLSMMVNQLVEEVRPVFEQRSIKTEISLAEIPEVFVDPDKLARALDNVLRNAAYYTPPGGEITVSLDSVDALTRMRISNTGAEIAPEKLARFFEKFYRGEEARQSETGGSGLGLAIAKSIIEAHGGSITAENKDRITTFTILI